MVGQRILIEGVLDIKTPASGFISGWRPPPWKTRHLKLVQDENGDLELEVYVSNKSTLVSSYKLNDVTDVTMVTSKTHLNAFEIISGGNSVVVIAGDSELESREWIWILRKAFWPHALEQTDGHDEIRVHLLSSQNISLIEGIYDLRITINAITLRYISKSKTGDDRSTPVEPFRPTDSQTTASFPLTSIGRFQLDQDNNGKKMIMETSADSVYGVCSYIFQCEEGSTTGLTDIVDIVKSTLFRATNSLHDCISASKWTFNTES
ncbi:hypothetical protein ACF0H5_006846 [Mactra antiquata]